MNAILPAIDDLKPTEHLYDFTLYTKADFVPNWHHRLLAEELMRIVNGELEEDGLLVSMPPSHSKSEMVIRRLCAYILGLNPTAKILIGTYDKSLSKRMSRDIKKIIQSPAYQEIFPVKISTTKKSDEEWETEQGGGVLAVGVKSGVTGSHFDLIIGDDLFQGWRAANSPQIRKTTNDWYDGDFSNREKIATTNDVPIIIMGTRWHWSDTIGMLLERERKDPAAQRFRKLFLPAYFTKDNEHLRHPKDTRAHYEPLFPAHKDMVKLGKEKAKGSAKFNALYLCLPFKATGDLLNPSWFPVVSRTEAQFVKRWKRFNHLPELTKTKIEDQSYATCLIGKKGKNYYIKECVREEVGHADFMDQVNNRSIIEKGIIQGFREKTSEKQLFNSIKKQRPRGRKYREIKFDDPLSIVQLAKSGRIYLVEGDYVESLKESLLHFNNTGANENESDIHALAGGVNMFKLRRSAA